MRRKRQRSRELVKEPRPPKPAEIGTAMGPLLEQAGLRKLAEKPAAPAPVPVRPPAQHAPRPEHNRPRPSAPAPAPASAPEASPLSAREESLLHQAYAGVAPIARPKRGRVERAQRTRAHVQLDVASERDARERLEALVGGGVRFEVERDDEFVSGWRADVSPKLRSRLSGSGFAPEAELDLHGMRQNDLARVVSEFVRSRQRRGMRYVLLITGKGQHSDGGVGVLRDATLEILTHGGAAPFVLAFSSAHPRHGGAGALAILLK